MYKRTTCKSYSFCKTYRSCIHIEDVHLLLIHGMCTQHWVNMYTDQLLRLDNILTSRLQYAQTRVQSEMQRVTPPTRIICINYNSQSRCIRSASLAALFHTSSQSVPSTLTLHILDSHLAIHPYAFFPPFPQRPQVK